MPGLNFDYTQFLKKQNALYLLKYQNDPIEAGDNPAPINGYHGHVPAYRASLHEQRMVRSLVRSLTSPMKPTTAEGFTKTAEQLPTLKKPVESPKEVGDKIIDSGKDVRRVQSAPPTTDLRKHQEQEHSSPYKGPHLSRLSLMSAGSADAIRQKLARSRASTAGSQRARTVSSFTPSMPLSREGACDSRASSLPYHRIERHGTPNHPIGHPQTLYGSSYWYAWADEKPKSGSSAHRPQSFQQDLRLNRNHNVIYHKHEGVVPKYMGYVPGYKFRHGATYGVLTVHATTDGAVHRRLAAQ